MVKQDCSITVNHSETAPFGKNAFRRKRKKLFQLQSGSKDPVAKQLRALVETIAAGDKAENKGRRFLDFAKKGDKK